MKSTKSPDQQKIETSVHESGHAVVAAAIGYPIAWVSIEPQEILTRHEVHDSSGHIKLDHFTDESAFTREEMDEIAAAGAAATRIIGCKGHASNGDYTLVTRRVMQAEPLLSIDDAVDESFVVMRAAMDRADVILRKHWGAVMRCAELLLCHEIIAGEDVVRAMKTRNQTTYQLDCGGERCVFAIV